MVGVQPPGAEISVSAGNLIMDRSLIGAFHGAGRPRVDFQWLVALYMDGRLKLDEINDAFDDMNRGMTAWTVLTFS